MTQDNEKNPETVEHAVAAAGPNLAVAEVLAAVLRSHGISAKTTGDEVETMVAPLIHGPGEGVPVVVPVEDLEEAKRILAEHGGEGDAEAGGAGDE